MKYFELEVREYYDRSDVLLEVKRFADKENAMTWLSDRNFVKKESSYGPNVEYFESDFSEFVILKEKDDFKFEDAEVIVRRK